MEYIKKMEATMTKGVPMARLVASNNKRIPIKPITSSVGNS